MSNVVDPTFTIVSATEDATPVIALIVSLLSDTNFTISLNNPSTSYSLRCK